MVLPHDLCARIQNAFRARHAHIAVNHTNQNLAILSILLQAGFLTFITRGTTDVPDPSLFHDAPDARRRIWAALKYREDRPVLSRMELVSLPSRRLFMDPHEVRLICSGRSTQFIKPLGMGEIAVIKTDRNTWLEAREAVRLQTGGEVVCRAQ